MKSLNYTFMYNNVIQNTDPIVLFILILHSESQREQKPLIRDQITSERSDNIPKNKTSPNKIKSLKIRQHNYPNSSINFRNLLCVILSLR